MSDNWFVLIPKDPIIIPEKSRLEKARMKLLTQYPKAEELNITVSKSIKIIDCGSNFEKIKCPNCGLEIPMEWWQENMDSDYTNESFKLDKFKTPCCNNMYSLNELIYQKDQGFAKFTTEIMNPNNKKIDNELIKEIEDILGINITIIYRHL